MEGAGAAVPEVEAVAEIAGGLAFGELDAAARAAHRDAVGAMLSSELGGVGMNIDAKHAGA